MRKNQFICMCPTEESWFSIKKCPGSIYINITEWRKVKNNFRFVPTLYLHTTSFDNFQGLLSIQVYINTNIENQNFYSTTKKQTDYDY